MVVLNLFVTPLYTGLPTADIATMIPTILFPFNLTKAVMNAALVLLLYKPISRTMKATGIAKLSEIKPSEMTVEQKKKRRRTNIGVAVAGVMFVAVSIFVFIVVLGGKIAFFK